MDLLVIGGTVFVGRHFAEIARDAGCRVTIFHRGSKGTGLIDGVEEVLGDRDGQLDRLSGRTWDAVVDSCGYHPRVVGQSVDALKSSVGRYVFVSTISVYRFEGKQTLPEDSEKMVIDDPSSEVITAANYGALKFLCEQQVDSVFGSKGTSIRAGLIAGPHDPTNRFTYWVDRFARGGPVLLPERLDAPQQLIDARDLGAFMLRAIEQELHGPYNCCGPAAPATFGDMIDACQTLNPESEPVTANGEFLATHHVALWQDLPLVMPLDGSSEAMNRGENAKAIAAGLRLRPWSETARDTWAWRRTLTEPPGTVGMDRERELEVLREAP